MRPMPRFHFRILLAGFCLLAMLAIAFLPGRRLDRKFLSRLRGAPAPPRELDGWTALRDAPFTRFESAVAVFENRIFLIGGFYNKAVQATAEVWEFDPERQSWAQKADAPTVTTHANAAMLGDAAWFAGGFIGDNPGTATEAVWRYDGLHDRWAQGPPLPEPRGGGALVALAGQLHFFGGYGPDRSASRGDHWVLNPADPGGGAWVAAAPLPKPRGHLAGAAVGNRIYAIGGADRHDPTPLDVPWVHRYDPASDSWTEVAPLPVPRSHFEQSTVVRDGRIVILGGRSRALRREDLTDVTEYDPVADRWLALPPLPKPVHSPFATLVEGRIFVGLGQSSIDGPDNFDVWGENTGGPWRPAPPPPVALGEVASAVIGEHLYLVGDTHPWTLALDLGTGRWASTEQYAARPAPGNHHAAEVWNGQLYLFGGIGAGAAGMVQIYDPIADRWRFGPPMPFAGGSMASALIGSQIYLAGGVWHDGTLSQATRFDPATELFTPIAPMPLPRNHAAAATDGRRLFVFGGRGPGSGDHNVVANGFDEVQIYDPATDTWVASGQGDSLPARLPQARGGMGKAVYDGREFWVFGGETADGPGADAKGVYNRVDIYDPVANRWRSGAAMPTARHGIFPVLVGNLIFVIGGGVRAGPSFSTIAEAIDLRSAYRAPDSPRP